MVKGALPQRDLNKKIPLVKGRCREAPQIKGPLVQRGLPRSGWGIVFLKKSNIK